MKIHFLFIVISLLFFNNCKKKNNIEPEIEGQVSGLTVNGSPLPREGMKIVLTGGYDTRCPFQNYSLEIMHRDAVRDSLREKLSIDYIPKGKLGKIPVKSITGNCLSEATCFFSMTVGDDLLIATYDVDKRVENWISIESFDSNTNEVKGTYDITLRETGSNERSRAIYPNVIRFKDAKFAIKLK